MLISRYRNRKFIFFLNFLGLDNIQLGFHINWMQPNLEIHLPFCFIKIGWQGSNHKYPYRLFGIGPI